MSPISILHTHTHTHTHSVFVSLCMPIDGATLHKAIGNQFRLCDVSEGHTASVLNFELFVQIRLMVDSAYGVRIDLLEVRDRRA
jgi:hypothetical protein